MAKMRETMDKARADANQKIGDILTKDQKAAFDKMLGEAFDVSKLRPNFGRPPGGGGDNSNDTPAAPKSKSRRGSSR